MGQLLHVAFMTKIIHTRALHKVGKYLKIPWFYFLYLLNVPLTSTELMKLFERWRFFFLRPICIYYKQCYKVWRFSRISAGKSFYSSVIRIYRNFRWYTLSVWKMINFSKNLNIYIVIEFEVIFLLISGLFPFFTL